MGRARGGSQNAATAADSRFDAVLGARRGGGTSEPWAGPGAEHRDAHDLRERVYAKLAAGDLLTAVEALAGPARRRQHSPHVDELRRRVAETLVDRVASTRALRARIDWQLDVCGINSRWARRVANVLGTLHVTQGDADVRDRNNPFRSLCGEGLESGDLHMERGAWTEPVWSVSRNGGTTSWNTSLCVACESLSRQQDHPELHEHPDRLSFAQDEDGAQLRDAVIARVAADLAARRWGKSLPSERALERAASTALADVGLDYAAQKLAEAPALWLPRLYGEVRGDWDSDWTVPDDLAAGAAKMTTADWRVVLDNAFDGQRATGDTARPRQMLRGHATHALRARAA